MQSRIKKQWRKQRSLTVEMFNNNSDFEKQRQHFTKNISGIYNGNESDLHVESDEYIFKICKHSGIPNWYDG